MAKIKLLVAVFLLLPLWVKAADSPPAGVGELRAMLKQHPDRYDLWVAVSDLEAQDNQPAQAAADMAHAVALRPDDIVLLKKHAQLAGWAGDNAAAERSYRAIVRLDPQDYDSLYLLGNVISWQGRNKEAAAVVKEYLSHRPEDKKALLFLAKLYQWNGNMTAAKETMERYKALAGADKEYSEFEVQRLAESGNDAAAIAAAGEALKKFPGDCELYTSMAQAESSARRWSSMVYTLAHAGTECSDKTAAADLSHRLGVPLRSWIRGGFSYATDNDGVRIGSYSLDGRYRVNPKTYLMAGAENSWPRANIGSGFETAQDNTTIGLYGGWAGAERMINDKLWVNGRAGYRGSDRGEKSLLAKAEIEYRPMDGLLLTDDVGHDIYAVSPRAVSVNVRSTDDVLHGAWRFARRSTLYWDAGYASLSDHNFFWTATVTPRQSVIVGEKLNVDLGVSAKLLSFHDPADGTAGGYYAPNRYRQFVSNMLASYAFDANDTVSIGINLGVVRDENQRHYGFSNDYSLEGVFGLYRGWQINPRLEFINDIGGSGEASTTYHRQQYILNVLKRF